MRCLLLLALASCGDNTIPLDAWEARSGSRIQLRLFTYEDGTTQWDPAIYFDRELVEHCSVRQWSDGLLYCTPESVPTVYSDSTCRTELGRWLTTQSPPEYFHREYTIVTGETISRLFRRGDAVAAPELSYQITNGQCVATLPNGFTYYTLGEELRSDRFAAISYATKPGDNRLGLEVYTTEDGFYMPTETDRPLLRDRALENICRVAERANSPTTTCEPISSGVAEFSRDSSCKPRDVMVLESGTAVPDVIVIDTNGCKTFARRGAEIPHVPIFLPIGESGCVSINAPADAHFFEVGAAFDVPVLMRKHEVIEGRRLQRIFVTDGVTTAVDTMLFDSELGVDCSRELVRDTYRCLPEHGFATVAPYFSDPQCLQPIEISLVESGPCDAATRFAVDHRAADPVVRPLVAPYVDKLYEISTADTCLEYVPLGRQLAFSVGAALPPERFMSAQ